MGGGYYTLNTIIRGTGIKGGGKESEGKGAMLVEPAQCCICCLVQLTVKSPPVPRLYPPTLG